jgi:hypothetical protein
MKSEEMWKIYVLRNLEQNSYPSSLSPLTQSKSYMIHMTIVDYLMSKLAMSLCSFYFSLAPLKSYVTLASKKRQHTLLDALAPTVDTATSYFCSNFDH